MFKTEWTHKPIPLTKEQQKILDFEIGDLYDELAEAGDLILHTVFLTDDWNGPIIAVHGKKDNIDTLFLTYYENPGWTSLNDFD
jgi:hypothetical protein